MAEWSKEAPDAAQGSRISVASWRCKNTCRGDNAVKKYGHFIDGKYVEPSSASWIDSMDPYRGEAWAQIPQGNAADADLAVKAASRAMTEGPWSKMSPSNRARLMIRLAELVEQNADRLAQIEVRDNGKLLAEMRGQVMYHPNWWRYFAGL